MMLASRTTADSSKERRLIGFPQNQFIRDTSEACAGRRATPRRGVFPGLAAYPLAIYKSTAGRHCFGHSVATRAGGGRANMRDRSHVHRVRSGNRASSWSGDNGPIGTGTTSTNDTGYTSDSVRARYDTSQQGKDSRNSKQRRFHH
jgi:hypothetical protein